MSPLKPRVLPAPACSPRALTGLDGAPHILTHSEMCFNCSLDTIQPR